MDSQTNNSVFDTLSPQIRQKLEEMQITQPTKVQEKLIPLIMEGKSTVFESETGTGKTYAYLLPLVNRLEQTEPQEKDAQNDAHH